MLEIKTFSSKSMGANCYIVSDGKNSIVIDPCVDYKLVKNYIVGELKGVFLTHGHFDHFDCIRSFEVVDAPVYAHKNAFEKMEDANKNCSNLIGSPIEYVVKEDKKKLINENVIEDIFEEIDIKVLNFPGHTNCSLVYIIENNMFTGDFIFKRSIGRTDLYSASNSDMKKSLNTLNNIKDNYVIHPGHGPQTTLYEEKENNYYLK